MTQARAVIVILEKLVSMLAPAYKAAWAAAEIQVRLGAFENIFLIVVELVAIIVAVVLATRYQKRITKLVYVTDRQEAQFNVNAAWVGIIIFGVTLSIVIISQIFTVVTALANPTWATMLLLLHMAGA